MSVQENLQILPLEEVIGDRFGRYSKYIIQDRALPDARDGLKPVQRRILYSMYREGNTPDKPFRKAAKTVGNVIGNYHPHGDSSVYEAMVRMSQDWKLREVLIEMHGNNGSIDGDPPAAMRYTEARLSELASELLKDIDKETVQFTPNFDDTSLEPTVLPARFPNLLVNGSTGISAGYATDIPPHHLGEVIDAVILRIDKPNCTVEDLMEVMKGPDFPTGGIIQGIEGIKKAYETGRGRIVVRAKTEIEKIRGGREQIVITEIPYDVNKANLVKKIDELRFERKLEGIVEVRDETDRSGLRIVIELRKDTDAENILNYLFKNTDLQINYNFNMVAIHNRRPKLMGLIGLLDAYIEHQKEVIQNRTRYELHKAEEREHIVEGLMKALSILDDIITTIRASKDKRDAKNNLIAKFGFTEKQSEAIVSLQLYRLTNTDVTTLEKEAEELKKTIQQLTEILSSEKKLLSVIKKELRQIKKKYADERKTKIEEKIEKIEINIEDMIPNEDVIVTITKEGYIKRTSLRSYSASNPQDIAMKETDWLIFKQELNTRNTLLLFTNLGNYLYLPVHEIPDIRWKDLGHHIAALYSLEKNENIIQVIPIEKFSEDQYVVFFTKNGMVKKSILADYKATRYSRPLIAVNLKNGDEVVNVERSNGKQDIIIATSLGYILWFREEEVNVVGTRAAGVKGIHLKEGDRVINGKIISPQEDIHLIVATQRGAVKKMKLSELEKTSRNKRGSLVLRKLKTNPHELIFMDYSLEDENLIVITNKGVHKLVAITELPFSERTSNGSFVLDVKEEGEPLGFIWETKEN